MTMMRKVLLGSHLLAHHEHVGAPQVHVSRLAAESIFQERCHSLTVEIIYLSLLKLKMRRIPKAGKIKSTSFKRLS